MQSFSKFFRVSISALVFSLAINLSAAGDLIDFLEKHSGISLGVSDAQYLGVEETPLEKECRRTFETPHQWNNGSPADRFWDSRCWEYVQQTGTSWTWLGDVETRRIAEEKRRKEEERQRKEAERLKKLEEERLAEIERKRKEAEEEARRKEEERQKKIETLLANYRELSLDDLEDQLSELGSALSLQSVRNHYAVLSFDHFLTETDSEPLAALDRAVSQAGFRGINISDIKHHPVEFILLNSEDGKASLDEDEFSVELGSWNLPALMHPKSVNVEQLRTHLEQSEAQFFVLLSLKPGLVTREITSHEKISSEYQSGEQTLPNPAYDRYVLQVQEQMMSLNTARRSQASCSATCSGAACFICLAWIGKIKEISDKRSMAQRNLNSTSPTITKPIYSDYEFRKNSIRINKLATTNIYVVDSSGSMLSRSVSENIGSRTYTLIYGLHEKDRNSYSHKQGISSEDEVSKFEKEEMTISWGDVKNAKTDTGDGAVASIYSLLEEKKDIEIEVATQVASAASPSLVSVDPRFHSVVMVLNPNGGLGTGFYVDPETILTNYHVVEGSDFHEIMLVDGEESFGKVIAEDIALDLALLKVQNRGNPVRFYQSSQLPVGATVDAIGHPNGLEFSLTRGTLSGVRRLPSLYDPSGRSIRFIQSDAAINPGNSGGPLFIGEFVVGVNDFKLAKTELEGLSFSIHLSEVKDFLRVYGISTD